MLGLLARGHSNRDIAQRLVVTPKTAANHVEHIYAKLGVSSRAAATLYATQHGLVAPSNPLADDRALRSAGEPVKETRVIIDETPRRQDGRRPKPHASPAYPPASGRGFPPTLTLRC